jgi:hypothetical protein
MRCWAVAGLPCGRGLWGHKVEESSRCMGCPSRDSSEGWRIRYTYEPFDACDKGPPSSLALRA